MDISRLSSRLREITQQTQSDSDLRDRMLKDPAGELYRLGIEIPDGHWVRTALYENEVEFFILPLKLDENELSIKELQQVAGGKTCDNPFGCLNMTGG